MFNVRFHTASADCRLMPLAEPDCGFNRSMQHLHCLLRF